MPACEFLLPSLENIPSQIARTTLFKISFPHYCKEHDVFQTPDRWGLTFLFSVISKNQFTFPI